ncbi:MAG: hypothetical protein ACLP5H_30800 [Desulfomonilaceae bacterium]
MSKERSVVYPSTRDLLSAAIETGPPAEAVRYMPFHKRTARSFQGVSEVATEHAARAACSPEKTAPDSIGISGDFLNRF